MFKLIAVGVLSLALCSIGLFQLVEGYRSWELSKTGKPGMAALTNCVDERVRGRMGLGSIETKYDCELVAESGSLQRVKINKRMWEKFFGQPVRASLLPDGNFVVTETAFVTRGLSGAILMFGMGLSFLLAVLQAHFRQVPLRWLPAVTVFLATIVGFAVSHQNLFILN